MKKLTIICLKKDHFFQREIPNKPQFNLKGNCEKGNSKCISVQFKGKLVKGKFQMYQISLIIFKSTNQIKRKRNVLLYQPINYYYCTTAIRNLKETEHLSSRKAEYDKHKHTIRKNPRFQSNIYA